MAAGVTLFYRLGMHYHDIMRNLQQLIGLNLWEDVAMERFETLERYWCGTARGYPVRVEEHRSDLSYIVEFYDGRDLGDDRCISYVPDPDELLTVDLLRQQVVAQPE